MDPFEDLIKVSLVPRVRVKSSPRSPTWADMRLRISAHHLMLDMGEDENSSEGEAVQDITIPHRNIDSVSRRPLSFTYTQSGSNNMNNMTSMDTNSAMSIGIGGRSFSISVDVADPCMMGNLGNLGNSKDNKDKDSNMVHVRCKDLRVVSVEFVRTEDAADVADSLEKLSALDDVARSFPFFYQPDFRALEDGWSMFPPHEELTAVLRSSNSSWRVSTVNRNFNVCRSYPSTVVVPSDISDDHLISSAFFRHGGRFPILSYRHAPTGKVLLRTSQPLCGPHSRRCREDEQILASVLGRDKRGFIIDTRTQATSHNERAKGGGYELEQYYSKWKRINKSIDRYYFLLDSYSKLMEACLDVGVSSDKWLSRVTISSWLTHIKEILNCGCLVAQLLDKEKCSVVVHGSEGVDITLCVTSLAQVILDPDCRTVRGFEALIQREWISAGHPFWSRTTKGPFSDSVAAKNRSHSPTFTIFLDCVRQIHAQFMRSFEFNESFLIALSDHAYASPFGTFLCDCELERASLGVRNKTISLWSHLNRPEILEKHINCIYEPNKGVIWPSVAPISLSVWSAKYLRWIIDLSPQEKAAQRAQEIVLENKLAKAKVLRLRKQLTEMLAEADRLGLVMYEDEEASEEEDVTLEHSQRTKEDLVLNMIRDHHQQQQQQHNKVPAAASK